jgi:hypothetical protein
MKTFLVLVIVVGCSALAFAKSPRHAQVTSTVAADCSLNQPPAEALSLVSEIRSALANDSSWKTETAKLLKQGTPLAVCAVRVAWNRSPQPEIEKIEHARREAATTSDARTAESRARAQLAPYEAMRKRAGDFLRPYERLYLKK